MAGTVTIAGSGGRSYGASAVFLTLNVAVSALLGASLGLAGKALPDGPLLALASVAAGAYALYFGLRARVPFWPWPPQLPATWLNRDRVVLSAARFGAVWGLTFATPIRAGSLVVLALFSVVRGDPAVSTGLFALVGFLRAAPAASMPFRSTHEERGLRGAATPDWHRPLVGFADAVLLALVLGAAVRYVLVPS